MTTLDYLIRLGLIHVKRSIANLFLFHSQIIISLDGIWNIFVSLVRCDIMSLRKVDFQIYSSWRFDIRMELKFPIIFWLTKILENFIWRTKFKALLVLSKFVFDVLIYICLKRISKDVLNTQNIYTFLGEFVYMYFDKFELKSCLLY